MKTIFEDTPIIPEVIADAVCAEAGELVRFFLDEPVVSLCERADRHYQGAGGPSFARRIRGKDGREYLHGFMRHWLAAMLLEAGCPREKIQQTPLL